MKARLCGGSEHVETISGMFGMIQDSVTRMEVPTTSQAHCARNQQRGIVSHLVAVRDVREDALKRGGVGVTPLAVVYHSISSRSKCDSVAGGRL